uniref:ShKT domain-containing protein n=1 Tax=Ascaris lumbricoides TaxID=6252 RepID=A0A9J2Q7X3_ASCLU
MHMTRLLTFPNEFAVTMSDTVRHRRTNMTFMMNTKENFETQYPPCCGDTIGSTACKRFSLHIERFLNIAEDLAFRICRRSCNYCRKDLYDGPQGRFLPASCGVEPRFVPPI